jgi:hypothetical protein
MTEIPRTAIEGALRSADGLGVVRMKSRDEHDTDDR